MTGTAYGLVVTNRLLSPHWPQDDFPAIPKNAARIPNCSHSFFRSYYFQNLLGQH